MSIDENVSFSVICQRTSSIKLAKAAIILGMIIPDTGLKTDPADVQNIANILCAGMISQCHVASPTLRDARETAQIHDKHSSGRNCTCQLCPRPGVVQILVFQVCRMSLYLHFVAFDFLYMVRFSRGRI